MIKNWDFLWLSQFFCLTLHPETRRWSEGKTNNNKFMATINVNVGKNDVVTINVNGDQQPENEQSIDKLYNILRRMLVKYDNDKYDKERKAWWYEVFADFNEDFEDAIYPVIKDMELHQAYTYCLGYMYMRDFYYDSQDYINDLNDMLNNCKF
jgi:hypothetical protein